MLYEKSVNYIYNNFVQSGQSEKNHNIAFQHFYLIQYNIVLRNSNRSKFCCFCTKTRMEVPSYLYVSKLVRAKQKMSYLCMISS